jgi:hypothetical protein
MPSLEDTLPQVYPHLRGLAAAKLGCETPGHTLNATALVHEAFSKLGGEAVIRIDERLSVDCGHGDAAHISRSCTGQTDR